MKQGWEIKKLGDVCKILNGGTPDTKISQYWDGENLWITPKDMGKLNNIFVDNTSRKITDEGLKNSSAKILPPNSIILSSRAPIGHLAINIKPTSTNQGCKGLIPNQTIDTLYLYYFLSKSVELLNSLGSGTTFKELSGSKLGTVDIPVPPLPEQERIVSILDKAFSAIEQAKQNAEKNLKNAKELFDSYLQEAFSNGNCEKVKLSELAKDVTDGDHMPPPKSDEGFPFITISNINKQNRHIDFSDTFKVPKEYFDKLKENRKPRKGDVLYTVTGSYGIPVLIEDDFEFCFQRHIGLIRPKENVSGKWLYYWILSPDAFFQANDTATGTAQKTVSLTALRSFLLPKMTLKEQQAIVQKLDTLSAETKQLEAIYQQKITELEELKKSILQKAFNGNL